MNLLKYIVSAAVGGVCGVALFIVISVPACMVLAIKHGNSRQAEAEVNSMPPIFIVAGAIIGLFIAVVDVQRKMAKRKKEEKERLRLEKEWLRQEEERQYTEHKRAKERHQVEQRSIELRLANLMSDSTQIIGNLPKLVRDAEHALDIADQDFREGAFVPFWEAIEQAANRLATFQSHIQGLTRNVAAYKNEASMLDSPPPPFQLEVNKLPDASRTVHRMNAIVRSAQKDYHFADIYVNLKTNQLLVAGFTTLGQAINNLGDSLHSSLFELESSVTTAISESSYAHQRAASDLLAEVQLSREESARDSEARREHEQKELDMLDNIQRHKKPR